MGEISLSSAAFQDGQLPPTGSCCWLAFRALFSFLASPPVRLTVKRDRLKQPLDATAKTCFDTLLKSCVVRPAHCYLSPSFFSQRIQSLMTRMTAMAREEVRQACSCGWAWRGGGDLAPPRLCYEGASSECPPSGPSRFSTLLPVSLGSFFWKPFIHALCCRPWEPLGGRFEGPV